jgi:hypothetical protein
MCNLYSITTNQEAIRQLFRVVNRYVGNLNCGDSAGEVAIKCTATVIEQNHPVSEA